MSMMGARAIQCYADGGVADEFVFDAATATLDSSTGQSTNENARIVVRNVQSRAWRGDTASR